MTPDLCPHCGQTLPRDSARITDRELDVLTAWWMAGTLRKAAVIAGVSEQRAKNMIRAARIRSGAADNKALLAIHFVAVRTEGLKRMQRNIGRKEAA